MNTLIVGAGSVGQVYARHLLAGGARVTFFVREKYRARYDHGLVLYPLNGRKPTAVRVEGYSLATSLETVRAERWDIVFLCIPSTALGGGWLPDFADAVGDATVVSLLPGIADRAALEAVFRPEQLVFGAVGFASYASPLRTETRPEPGMAYWFFPGSANRYSGRPDRVRPLLTLLRRGKFPARADRHISRSIALSVAATTPLILALEACAWSLAEFRRSPRLAQACAAARECVAIAAREFGMPRAIAWAIRPLLIKQLLALAPKVVPFDLEALLEAHYSKVGPQSRHEIAAYLERARRYGFPAPATEAVEREARAHLPQRETV